MERGGAVLSARVPTKRAEALLSVLDAFDPVDQTERSELILEQARANGRDEVVRLFEEKLNIAKRTVQRGTTRVRRYVVERPVEESVTLMEEHAEVLRRAVDDPGFVADVDWSEQTIEVAEMGEEAVVSKAARVAEEVVIRKTDSSRVERVQDTVRRQHVEVEHVAHDKDTAKA